jgi:hypothetical protein
MSRGESSRIAYVGTAAFGCPPGEARDCSHRHKAEGFTEGFSNATSPHFPNPTNCWHDGKSYRSGEVPLCNSVGSNLLYVVLLLACFCRAAAEAVRW